MTEETTQPKDGFEEPHTISDAQYAFPARLKELLPTKEQIPKEFWRGHTPWNRFVSEWFFSGWPARGLYSREDIDPNLAFRHLHTIMRSFEPKHEHKEAAVAWLASRWFESVGEEFIDGH